MSEFAEIRADGSVVLPVRVEGPDGAIGDAIVIVRPGDPGYADALEAARVDAEAQDAISRRPPA